MRFGAWPNTPIDECSLIGVRLACCIEMQYNGWRVFDKASERTPDTSPAINRDYRTDSVEGPLREITLRRVQIAGREETKGALLNELAYMWSSVPGHASRQSCLLQTGHITSISQIMDNTRLQVIGYLREGGVISPGIIRVLSLFAPLVPPSTDIIVRTAAA